jgi:hypothetical protein
MFSAYSVVEYEGIETTTITNNFKFSGYLLVSIRASLLLGPTQPTGF